MNLIRWQPFSDMVTLRQAMDRLFEDSFVSSATKQRRPSTCTRPMIMW